MTNDQNFSNMTVRITWSENKKLDDLKGKILDVADINRTFRDATKKVLLENCGYAKTTYTAIVMDDTGATNKYHGRIDVGSDTQDMFHVVQDSINAYLKYRRDYGDATQQAEIIQWQIWMLESKKSALFEEIMHDNRTMSGVS